MTFWATIDCMQLDHLPSPYNIYTFAITSTFTIYIIVIYFLWNIFSLGNRNYCSVRNLYIAMSCHKRVPGLLCNCLLTVTIIIVSKVLQSYQSSYMQILFTSLLLAICCPTQFFVACSKQVNFLSRPFCTHPDHNYYYFTH